MFQKLEKFLGPNSDIIYRPCALWRNEREKEKHVMQRIFCCLRARTLHVATCYWKYQTDGSIESAFQESIKGQQPPKWIWTHCSATVANILEPSYHCLNYIQPERIFYFSIEHTSWNYSITKYKDSKSGWLLKAEIILMEKKLEFCLQSIN